MYSTVKKPSWTSRPQIESKALTIETGAETVFLEAVDPDLDAQFTEAREFFGDPPLTPLKKGGDRGINLLLDRSSEQQEKYSDLYKKQKEAEFVSIENNLNQLKQEINQLEISLIQPPEKLHDTLDRRFNQGMENLQAQADHINELAAQLEKEMLKFKAMAREVNRDYHAIQESHRQANPTFSNLRSSQPYRTRPANVWEIRSWAIPTVLKQGNQFILTTKQVLEVAKDNAENRAKKAQQRQKALSSWLEAKRQRIVEDFSRP